MLADGFNFGVGFAIGTGLIVGVAYCAGLVLVVAVELMAHTYSQHRWRWRRKR